ncbi:AraC family transcriptional regulator [Pseudomonas mangiferae]|uniref:Helix-turn-helix domain-containing protein n=1 Tax=Pseudomonas mangiferae TaxID=2593654 RepID=A0A553H2U2_9PSED|nr:nuclear transport factor 2 family protein [Pseudomonas mangiferae]TRX76068.1 helix-turn-helix domain-containing protein [Pseudomonas mangiferae]
MDSTTERTREVVGRYHRAWLDRDLDGILSLYHRDIEYFDFFNNRRLVFADMPDYVRTALPRSAEHRIEHVDRIRVDGDTAFIQYCSRLSLRRSSRLASFRASEAITVKDGLIVRVHEYATMVRDDSLEPAAKVSRLGLSRQQLSMMLMDLEQYFADERGFLEAEFDLTRLASAVGYTRNQVSYLLNQVLGLSFYQYLNQARIDWLLRRLAEQPEARPDELAFTAGFNSLSVFYRCFRERTGMSPRAYLKQRPAKNS